VLADGDHMRVPLFLADAAASGLPGRQMLDAAAHRPGFRMASATTGMTDAETAEAVFQDRRLSHAYAQKSFSDRWSYKGMAWLASDEALAIYDQEVGRIFTDDDEDDGLTFSEVTPAEFVAAQRRTATGGEHGQNAFGSQPRLGSACTVKNGGGRFGDEGAAGTIVEADGALCCLANNLVPLDAQGRKVLKGLTWQPNDSMRGELTTVNRSEESEQTRVHVDGVGDVIGPDNQRRTSRPFIGNSNLAVQRAYDEYDASISKEWSK
jgi:hypothetical protein